MEINKFIELCDRTIDEKCKNENYLMLGLESESGEVAGVIKKYIRGDFGLDVFRERMVSELGDVLWYLAMITKYYNPSFKDITYPENIIDCSDIDKVALNFRNLGVISMFKYFDVNECQEAVIKKLESRAIKATIRGDGEGDRS
jgi:NTP pyrophosphatase (non-canonical NTP hydrolase)